MIRIRSRQSGFTIIELLIATTVFSVVLLVISGAIIQIGRLYTKSINSVRTQEVARSIISDMSESIQFNPGSITGTFPAAMINADDPTSRGVCVGNRVYSYKFGQQQDGDQPAFVAQNLGVSDCTGAVVHNMTTAASGDTVELLGDKMRLANLEVRPLGGDAYRLLIRVVYGDTDLLCSPAAVPASIYGCTSTAQRTATQEAFLLSTERNLSCKNIRSGSQFCSVSELSKIVKRRL